MSIVEEKVYELEIRSDIGAEEVYVAGEYFAIVEGRVRIPAGGTITLASWEQYLPKTRDWLLRGVQGTLLIVNYGVLRGYVDRYGNEEMF